MEFKIQWKGTPNYKKGRNGKKIIAIVNHITQGLMPGTLSWMQNPNSKASANYLVTRKGEILQLVRDVDTSYHAGIANKPQWALYDGTNPNFYTIGIEHEGMTGEPLTEIQYQATLWLHRYLTDKYNISLDDNHIIGHYRIDGVNRPNCPGKAFPWSRLFADLRKGVVDNMIEDWQKKLGIDASNRLEQLGLLKEPKQYKDKMDEKVDMWLFFEMLKRLAEK